MRIAFHSDAFAGQVRYGLGRYSHELWQALRERSSSVELQPFALRGRRPAASFGEPHGMVRPGIDGRAVIAAWATIGAPFIERWVGGADLVHTVELDYPVATRRPWVVTVHDLGPLTHPEYFSRSRPWLRRRALRQAAKSAAAIVAVSAVTADAVESLARQTLGDRLLVVPEGVNAAFFEDPDTQCLVGLDDLPPAGVPYFLWTGSLNPRKNLANVLRAFEVAAGEVPHHLVLAGGLGWDSDPVLEGLMVSRCAHRVHRPGYVADDQLRALYRGADGFLYVSLMEGFGLPILEAMAAGCPVVTSTVSSMPEVAGNAALLVDPLDPDAIAAAMLRIGSDAALRQDLGCRGRARAETFTWQRCADHILEVYGKVAGP